MRKVNVTNYFETEGRQCDNENVTVMSSSDWRKRRRDFDFLLSGEECKFEMLFGDFSKNEFNSDRTETGELRETIGSKVLKPGL